MTNNLKYHFIVTGGHHNSALVVAKDLIKLGHQVSWLGHRHTSLHDTQDSAEYLEVTQAGIDFYELKAGKSGSLRNLAQFPLGLVNAYQLVNRLKPTAILSFGSYLGISVSLVAYLQHIPVFIHEQTVVAGMANRLVGSFAKKIYLTWDSSKRFFPSKKSLIVGLPLRPTITQIKAVKLFNNSLPTILIMGGKQGSHFINQQIFANLPQLLTHYNLIHQTGTSSFTQDYQQSQRYRRQLPQNLAKRYLTFGYIDEVNIARYLHGANIYLGRSGAHISYELAILGKPSILIPFLATHLQEQLQNARYLQQHGLGVILKQVEMNSVSLMSSLKQALKLHPHPISLPKQASKLIIQDLINEISI